MKTTSCGSKANYARPSCRRPVNNCTRAGQGWKATDAQGRGAPLWLGGGEWLPRMPIGGANGGIRAACVNVPKPTLTRLQRRDHPYHPSISTDAPASPILLPSIFYILFPTCSRTTRHGDIIIRNSTMQLRPHAGQVSPRVPTTAATRRPHCPHRLSLPLRPEAVQYND